MRVFYRIDYYVKIDFKGIICLQDARNSNIYGEVLDKLEEKFTTELKFDDTESYTKVFSNNENYFEVLKILGMTKKQIETIDKERKSHTIDNSYMAQLNFYIGE